MIDPGTDGYGPRRSAVIARGKQNRRRFTNVWEEES